MTIRTVIEGCAIATVDATQTEYHDGHLVIDGERIVAVGEGSAPDGAGGPAARTAGPTGYVRRYPGGHRVRYRPLMISVRVARAVSGATR